MFSGQKIAASYAFPASRHIFSAINISSSSGYLLGLLHGYCTGPRRGDQNILFLRRLQEV
jgi:hypothetical protein